MEKQSYSLNYLVLQSVVSTLITHCTRSLTGLIQNTYLLHIHFNIFLPFPYRIREVLPSADLPDLHSTVTRRESWQRYNLS